MARANVMEGFVEGDVMKNVRDVDDDGGKVAKTTGAARCSDWPRVAPWGAGVEEDNFACRDWTFTRPSARDTVLMWV